MHLTSVVKFTKEPIYNDRRVMIYAFLLRPQEMSSIKSTCESPFLQCG